MRSILLLLNNTFLGTLSAGGLLALFGFYLYRKQKEVDIKYEDRRRRREQASLLYATIEIALKKYEEQLNLYSRENHQLYNLITEANKKFNNHFENESVKEFNTLLSKIQNTFDDLIGQLKINGCYDPEIKTLTENIPIFTMYLLSRSVLHLSKTEEIEEYRKGVNKSLGPIKTTLRSLII